MKLVASGIVALVAGVTLASCGGGSSGSRSTTTAAPTRTIIMVWDGLRPDSVTAADTPNLYELRQSGVNFSDNHATYPTFTMMNGSSFATGSFPKTSGFYGNTFWTPPQGTGNTIPSGNGAGGTAADYQDPVFTEDYQILTTLNNYYGGQLLLVKTLFAAAQGAGLVTATVGKTGAAYIQNLGQGGYFIDENTVQPRSLVTELQNAGYAIPANTVHNYSGADAVTLAGNNGSPTAKAGYITFNTTAYDPGASVTVSARDSSDATQGEPADGANKYMMSVFTQFILPQKKPMLSLIWFRTPDNAEHGYGPGTANYKAALHSQDARLGELISALRANGMDTSTNIVVVSDHGHSSVSGPLATYPLRAITGTSLPNGAMVNGATSGTTNAAIGAVSDAGYSFSGDVRSADLLWYRGFKAYDGSGCSTSAMYGLSGAATPVPTLPVQVDATGTLCGTANTKYQAVSAAATSPAASFKVPAPGSLPANAIVVAANGGSDYFYVPSHDPATVQNLVRFLQQREEYGAIFVDSRYGTVPGTFSMAMVNLENATRQDNGQPDVVVSFAWDDTATIQGMNGIEFESAGGQRGMHGSFGTTDVHNTLIANGPSFKGAAVVSGPSGNVDVAPTVAYLLGTSLPQADGRVLNEALTAPASSSPVSVTASTLTPAASASGLTFESLTDLTGATPDPTHTAGNGTYSINLNVKDLSVDGKTYRYFDHAKAVRN